MLCPCCCILDVLGRTPSTERSNTLMLPGMYTNFGLGADFRDEYDADVSLECDEESAYENFYEFYDDVLPEFKEYGTVTQLKVSNLACNIRKMCSCLQP